MEPPQPVLAKRWRVAIDGRLEWREWNADDHGKRQAITVVGNVESLPHPPRTSIKPPLMKG